MISAFFIAISLFVTALYLHLFMLRCAKAISPPETDPHYLRLVAGSLLILASHLIIAALFACGFYLGEVLDLGGFEKEVTDSWMDYYYFSLITISTVGLGDIYPTDHLRIMTGIASLTGFLMISCTAQYVYKTMSQQDRDRGQDC